LEKQRLELESKKRLEQKDKNEQIWERVCYYYIIPKREWDLERCPLSYLLIILEGDLSSIHVKGNEAKIAIEEARAKIASFIGTLPSEIYFASGGT